MTQSRWLAACAASLLLGGNAGQLQAQCCLPCGSQPPEAARAPFYNELPQIIFPAQAPVLAPHSNPVVWARLFEAVASNRCQPCQASASCNPRERCRVASQNRRMAFELLKLYRLFYREGHYHAAEIVADRAAQLDPSNVAAEAALCMARLATDAIDHCEGMCGDAEDCEVIPPPADACVKDCEKIAPPAAGCGMCVGAAVMSKARPCAPKPCCTRASCACGESCPCAGDEPCACGEKCCCKQAGRQNVLNGAAPRVIVIQVPAMMCPPCPACPGFQAALPHPVAAMIPQPLPGMMPPPVPPMFAQPPMNVMIPNGACPPGCCVGGPMAWRPAEPAEQLPTPRLMNGPVPGTGLMCGAANPAAADALRIAVCGKQIAITCPPLKACCDSATALPDGRALLEGNVTVTFTRDNRPAKIQAKRMIVDLEDGSYEVSPEPLKPISHNECCPEKKSCPDAKKKLIGPGKVCPTWEEHPDPTSGTRYNFR